jgi:hypothetical protein
VPAVRPVCAQPAPRSRRSLRGVAKSALQQHYPWLPDLQTPADAEKGCILSLVLRAKGGGNRSPTRKWNRPTEPGGTAGTLPDKPRHTPPLQRAGARPTTALRADYPPTHAAPRPARRCYPARDCGDCNERGLRDLAPSVPDLPGQMHHIPFARHVIPCRLPGADKNPPALDFPTRFLYNICMVAGGVETLGASVSAAHPSARKT